MPTDNGKKLPLPELLRKVQEYITKNYPTAIKEGGRVRAYIEKYLHTSGYEAEGLSTDETIDRLYLEMAEYSILTPFLHRDDIEEINVNSWDDIAVTDTNGQIHKLPAAFYSPTHASDIIKRLLGQSGIVIDQAIPIAEGHLPPFRTPSGIDINTRVAAVQMPIVDGTCGISASIRLLHPSAVTVDEILSSGEATKEMIDFLLLCLWYGVSFVIAGATSSGKTTLLNALLATIPDDKRVFTIESGSRELYLKRRGSSGKISNNVVHTLSKASDNAAYRIEQEKLVETALRFCPNIIAIGEMRNVEAHAAVEASLTGHTVVSTIHATAADAAHMRLSLLCQRKYPIDISVSLLQAAEAFPIVVYTHRMNDNSRKVVNISECDISSGERKYRTLYRYVIENNTIDAQGHARIVGHFERVNFPSESLIDRLLRFGAPMEKLECYRGGDK